MKANKAEQQALVTLLNRIYGEIRAIEEQWDIRVSESDFRPRIEYFHDAIRALTAGGGHGYEKSGRLSVEFLAYDIGMLRHIQERPMAKPRGAKLAHPPGSVTLPATAASFTVKGDSSVRYELSDRYKSYSVLFVALLSDTADRNYQNRLNECNSEVEELARLEKKVRQAANNKDVTIDLQALAEEHLDEPDLIRRLLAGAGKAKLKASEALRAGKEIMAANDRQIKTIEKAHFTYATSQLAIYEGARDVVKKMATSGMNIVGDFVQNAVSEAARGGKVGR